MARRLGRRAGPDLHRPVGPGRVGRGGLGALEVRAFLDVTEAVRRTGLLPEQVETLVTDLRAPPRGRAGPWPAGPRGARSGSVPRAPGEIAAQRGALGRGHQLAVSLQDVLLRLTGLVLVPAWAWHAESVGLAGMGALLSWSPPPDRGRAGRLPRGPVRQASASGASDVARSPSRARHVKPRYDGRSRTQCRGDDSRTTPMNAGGCRP